MARSQSLAFRLSLWYGFSSFLPIASVTAFLYWVLPRNFEQQNDRCLAEKIAILRTLLRESRAKEATVKWEVEEELSAHPSIRVPSRVLGRDGNPLFETPGMSEELPERVFTHQTEAEVRSVSGRAYRVLRTELKGANGQRSFNIHAAIDLAYQRDLLHHYRNQLWASSAPNAVAVDEQRNEQRSGIGKPPIAAHLLHTDEAAFSLCQSCRVFASGACRGVPLHAARRVRSLSSAPLP